MRILLDTNVALELLWKGHTKRSPELIQRLADPSVIGFVSVASLWEMAIKTRLGKLDPGMPLADIAGFLEALGATILPIEARHVIAAADPQPETGDPFDRLLLALCQIDDLRLATFDRTLLKHPLALKF